MKREGEVLERIQGAKNIDTVEGSIECDAPVLRKRSSVDRASSERSGDAVEGEKNGRQEFHGCKDLTELICKTMPTYLNCTIRVVYIHQFDTSEFASFIHSKLNAETRSTSPRPWTTEFEHVLYNKRSRPWLRRICFRAKDW